MLDHFCDENTLIIVCGENKVPRTFTLKELYPYPNIYLNQGREQVTAFGRHFFKQAQSPLDFFTKIRKPTWQQLYQKIKAAAAADEALLHPIAYVAGVLFSNNKSIFVAQHNAIEYGCSLDAVSRLSPFLEHEQKKGITAELILLTDNFGTLHAPCSVARAFLHEKHFGSTKMVVHTREGEVREVDVGELVPFSPNVDELFRKPSKM